MAPGLPERVCTVGLQARTQYTPRHDPENTSITSIVVPASDGYVPRNEKKQVYSGPDVENSCFQVPDGAFDVLATVSNRRLSSESTPQTLHSSSSLIPRNLEAGVVPGKGWQVVEEPPGYCNGEYGSICGRGPDDSCPLLGHHDARGSVMGNEYSGWLVMELPNVREGLVILKLFTWKGPNSVTRTNGWTSVNNEGPPLQDDGEPKALKDLAELPESFSFEYAIEGQITSLDKEQFISRLSKPQRVMEMITLVDDANFAAKDSLQIGIRMTGCGRTCTFGLSHIYWA